MSSSSWEIEGNRFGEIQEDLFDDDSDQLSNYEDSLYIDDLAVEEHQKLNEATITNHLPPRHSTVAEESNIDTGVEEHQKLTEAAITSHLPPRLSTITEESNIGTEGNEIGARENTYVDSVFGRGLRRELSGENVDIIEGSPLFRGGQGIEKLQRDQESFYEHKQLTQDDFRFNELCLEKENSWEPSIHRSPPPTPKIYVDELAAFNVTNSHLIPAISSKITTRKEASRDIENTPPDTSSYMRHMKKGNESEQNSSGPKMSTPKSTDTSLRDLSINCISSIHPETSPKSVRGMNSKFSDSFVMGRRISKVMEESLTSSAIHRILENENFDNDERLVQALLRAKTSRFKLKFPEIVAGEQPGINDQMKRCLRRCENSTDALGNENKDSNANDQIQKVITRHDHSGVTNKTKKLKTVQELNLLQESNSTQRNLPPILKPKWESENSKARYNRSLSQTDAENQGKFLSCNPNFVYFGFVGVRCRVNRTVRLRNISTKSLNLRLQLHSVSKGYELLEQGIVVLKPEESHLVHIIFQPPSGAFFQNYLDIRVLNAEHINYSIPLLGSGGVAALRVLMQSGLTMLRDGSFVLTTQGITNINFDVENKGLRDAFVRVVVMNKETKKAIDRCTVAPSDCVSILHRSKQKFSIEVLSLGDEKSIDNSNHSFPISSFSIPSVAGNTQYYVQLLWGEEAQRRRLKRFENEKCANFTFNGHTFTKCKFINEEQCKSTASEDACYGFFDRDAFELGLRVTLISVVDNRFGIITRNSYLPQEKMLTESVILEPKATMSPTVNKSVVEDVSMISTASRFL